MPFLAILTALTAAVLSLSPVLTDWTVTISPASDPSRCLTSTGVGNPVKILPCDSSESQKWTTWDNCGTLIWHSSPDTILQAGYSESIHSGHCPHSPAFSVGQPRNETTGSTGSGER